MQPPQQLIAIDWSGAASPAAQRSGIRAAVCHANLSDPALHPGMLRSEAEAWLLQLADAQAPVVAGLDFSFSYPAWFLRELGCGDAPALWAHVAAHGEQWLRAPHPHFWGRRRGSGQPAGHRLAPGWLGYRGCERAAAQGTRLPLSSFQIGGAGAVGTGTLRGMPMLARLRAAGWSVWPFDPPRLPMLVEIYPRLLTGPVVKSSAAARGTYLAHTRFAPLSESLRIEAATSEDSFDALVSALCMREHAANFALPRQAADEQTQLEGAIWRPLASGPVSVSSHPVH